MAGKKVAGENTKKASGNAKKAEAAAQRAAAENAKKSVEEDQEWSKGAKSNAKNPILSRAVTAPLHPTSPTNFIFKQRSRSRKESRTSS
jgi:hypothetical protein